MEHSKESGILPLPLNLKLQNGNQMAVHAALLWGTDHLVLVDTGVPGQLDVIREGLEQAGFSLDQLTHVIITHQDRDHIGSLPELIRAKEGKLEVLAHEEGIPYLAGEIPLIKGGAYAESVKVNTALHDGDDLPFGGGLRVVYTPGHTPDHISLYHPSSKTLISGDAVVSSEGQVQPPVPNFTQDYPQALRSVKKLAALDVETVITYHGGVCTGAVQERLKEIAAGVK
ncbi:MBL fold metallo-hydrolase [Paenibacillus phoenicis]|uniref:MBL fold metallo-hydrolase n=1 Tax=Paenibacillus phoenicis TaxID=554117 RepID=A0ABU5PLQ5_9BACL|nr:MBL fold metallo-hydrolase [Paenibacillus phoenicis]MEA3570871.1 MBL fold metallo-hydrolase [Paenibacillus phoenicis]